MTKGSNRAFYLLMEGNFRIYPQSLLRWEIASGEGSQQKHQDRLKHHHRIGGAHALEETRRDAARRQSFHNTYGNACQDERQSLFHDEPEQSGDLYTQSSSESDLISAASHRISHHAVEAH